MGEVYVINTEGGRVSSVSGHNRPNVEEEESGWRRSKWVIMGIQSGSIGKQADEWR